MKLAGLASLFVSLLGISLGYAQTWTESAHVTIASRIGHSQYNLAFSQGIAIGGHFMDENVTILEKNILGEWGSTVIQEVNPPSHWGPPNFGYSSAIYNGIAVIGSPGNDYGQGTSWFGADTGALFVFEKDQNGNWVQKQKLISANAGYRTDYEFLGVSVAIYDQTIAAGANWSEYLPNGDQYNDGSVYVFERDGSGIWQKKQILKAPDKTDGDFFGYSISIHDRTMVIGAHKNDTNSVGADIVSNSGSVYIFEKDNSGNWIFKQKITASVRTKDATFGESVSVYETSIVVGTHEDPFGVTGGGAAYVFTKDNNGIWQEAQRLVASDLGYWEYFGGKVAIGSDVIVIGAHSENHDEIGQNNLNSAGALYLFTRDETGSWMEHKKICASDRSANRGLGVGVAVDGNSIAAMDITNRNLYFFEKIDLLDQTITFEELDEVIYNSSAFKLSASTTSSLAIVFSTSNPSIAAVNGNMVTPITPGVVTIGAHQPGNQIYEPATARRTLVVGKSSQQIIFDEIPEKLVTDDDFVVIASSSTGMPLTFHSNIPSVATIDQTGKVQILTAGETVLTVSQLGDQFTKEASASRTLRVSTILNVEDLSFNEYFRVFPNPTEGELFIEMQEPIHDSVYFSIYNQMGQIVGKGECYYNINHIDLNHISPGVFFLQLLTKESETRIKLIIR
ncbi:MAG: T9SS type A sorting domain-containing protein [Cytophagales bacterium]|nr:T9SS type A sorting domain-containing protein [Cytophagales bacterium]